MAEPYAYEYHVYTKQGKRGRYRFMVYKVGFDENWNKISSKYHAGGSPYGYATEYEAGEAAAAMLNGEWNWGT